MTEFSRRSLLASMLAVPASAAAWSMARPEEWIPLFDGKSLNGWKAGENPGTFKVEDGAIIADGPRAHLFYEGPVRGADFKNFELKVDVLTRPKANSGIFFHTRFQEKGWPAHGFEVQVNNTATGSGGYIERRKTGSLYGVRNVYKALAKDDKWFQMHIVVRGKNVQVLVDGRLLVDYTEPESPFRRPNSPGNVIAQGTFALQGHDPGSKVHFRNILVRPLGDTLPDYSSAAPVFDDVDREIVRLGGENFPMVDYHVHLKGGWTLEQALAFSRRHGIFYGIAENLGIGFPIDNDAGIRAFLDTMKDAPVYLALQGEGREWMTLVTKETIAKFDYVFTDSMTFTDDNGKRMRLWINREVGEIADKEKFMETIVDRAVGVLSKEPIDIYVNPTFLPQAMAADYDRFWTPERMQRVIDAAVKNDVAIEINQRYKIPSAAFIKRAKAAGAKFSFGTNNGDADIGRLEYCIRMVKECGLTWQDIFVPKPDGQKKIQTRAW